VEANKGSGLERSRKCPSRGLGHFLIQWTIRVSKRISSKDFEKEAETILFRG
jgi:hypothetical protein